MGTDKGPALKVHTHTHTHTHVHTHTHTHNQHTHAPNIRSQQITSWEKLMSPTGPFHTPLPQGSTRKHQLRETHVLSWALTFNTLFKSRRATSCISRTMGGTSAQYSIEHAG